MKFYTGTEMRVKANGELSDNQQEEELDKEIS